MPDIDDFYAFKTTSGDGNHGNYGGGGSGCFTWIFIGLVILWLIGVLFG